MSLYSSVTDLFRQVANILQPAHGGTGHSHGSEWVLVRGINSTGSTINLYNLVQFTGATNAGKVSKVTATNSTHVLGVCVGYYDGQKLVESNCPDGYEMAVCIAGVVPILIESAVTRDQYAFSAATDGQITSSATVSTGAFGRIVDSQDVSTGATTARVALGLPGSGSGGGGASYGTPGLTLSTTNAAGSSGSGIQTDATIAAFDATAPVTQAFGDAAATGSAAKAARRDHKHGMPANPAPSQGTPALTFGTTNAAGSSGQYVGTDATISAFDATAPVTQAMGDAAAAGSAGVAARRDHKHGMPAFATPAIVLGSAAAAGSAATPIRSDGTIAAFDTTAPTTQAPSDAATVGTAAFAARRDHKHGWPAFGTGSSDIAQGNHTHGAAGGGVWDTIVVKSADESVTSSTALQDDDELFVTGMVSGGYYEFEAHIFHDAGAGSSNTDIKFTFGEDNTFRGYVFRVAGNSGTGTGELVVGSIQLSQSFTAQTGNGVFGIYVRGNWVSGGSNFKLQWAQNSSNVNALKVKAGSTLKIKRLA